MIRFALAVTVRQYGVNLYQHLDPSNTSRRAISPTPIESQALQNVMFPVGRPGTVMHSMPKYYPTRIAWLSANIERVQQKPRSQSTTHTYLHRPKTK
jgi:hypothetical protein